MQDYYYHKRVWITGASSGIGEALALALARRNAHLILSSRKESELQRVAAACQETGAASVLVQPLDLAEQEPIPAMVAAVLRQVGKVDILINNGGVSQRARALETSLEIDKRIMNINYFGAIALTKALLPSMLTHQLGHIVVISSVMGKHGWHLRSAYAASKHALHGFFDSLRMELGPDAPVQITLVCPGSVRTGVSVNALRGDGSSAGAMDNLIDKGMHPDRLAEKILKAVANGREEVNFGGREVLGIYLKRFFPRYFSRMALRSGIR